MARTVLLVALALAPAALALGVTKPNDPTIPCDCPETIEGGGIVLPCGADGESYEVDPCNVFACYITDPAPQTIDEAICNNCGGLYTAPAAGECGGKCDCNPTAIYLGEEVCGQQGGTWIHLVFHCSLDPPGYCDLP